MPPDAADSGAEAASRTPTGELDASDKVVDDCDTPAEVDAVFRVQRRIAAVHLLLFLLATLAVPTLTLVLDWWSTGRLLGGMTPNFAMVAFGLYLIFFGLGVAAATLSSAVEDRMLGGPRWADRQGDWYLEPPSTSSSALHDVEATPEGSRGDDGHREVRPPP